MGNRHDANGKGIREVEKKPLSMQGIRLRRSRSGILSPTLAGRAILGEGSSARTSYKRGGNGGFHEMLTNEGAPVYKLVKGGSCAAGISRKEERECRKPPSR